MTDHAQRLRELADNFDRRGDADRARSALAAADTLDAIAALVGPGDVVERVRALVASCSDLDEDTPTTKRAPTSLWVRCPVCSQPAKARASRGSADGSGCVGMHARGDNTCAGSFTSIFMSNAVRATEADAERAVRRKEFRL